MAVKNRAAGAQAAPRRWLLAQERGGARGSKHLEGALRHAGALAAGRYAVPGAAARRDAHGNIARSQARALLAGLKTGGKGKSGKGSVFAGRPLGARRPDGVWQRDGARLRPLLVFARRAPQYRARLHFGRAVRAVAQEMFADEFRRAFAQMQGRHTGR